MAKNPVVEMICRVCGLRVKGVIDRWGRLLPTNRARTDSQSEPVVGICAQCENKREERELTEINKEIRKVRRAKGDSAGR